MCKACKTCKACVKGPGWVRQMLLRLFQRAPATHTVDSSSTQNLFRDKDIFHDDCGGWYHSNSCTQSTPEPFLDAIASLSTCPCQSVGQWVIDSFRFSRWLSHLRAYELVFKLIILKNLKPILKIGLAQEPTAQHKKVKFH